MKHTLEMIQTGEDEVIIRCHAVTAEIGRLLELLRTPHTRLLGVRDGQQVVIDPADILYIESVDSRTFVCTRGDVLQVDHTLAQLETILNAVNFFRCSKSMILNIDQVAALKSLACSRIDATLRSGEHIIITRTYASEFRRRLKGGQSDD